MTDTPNIYIVFDGAWENFTILLTTTDKERAYALSKEKSRWEGHSRWVKETVLNVETVLDID